jgi:hypothetical protein
MLGCSDRAAYFRRMDLKVCQPSSTTLALVSIAILGFVVSDWGATHDSANDNANAGLDMEQPGDYIVIGTKPFCCW